MRIQFRKTDTNTDQNKKNDGNKSGLALKNPPKKTHPQKPKKTHLKNPLKIVFLFFL
jgi:hypothetical protein